MATRAMYLASAVTRNIYLTLLERSLRVLDYSSSNSIGTQALENAGPLQNSMTMFLVNLPCLRRFPGRQVILWYAGM